MYNTVTNNVSVMRGKTEGKQFSPSRAHEMIFSSLKRKKKLEKNKML